MVLQLSLSGALRVAFAVGLVSASACASAPGLNVTSWEPSAVLEPRGADRLILVDGEGRASGRRHVADLFVEAARGGFFSAEDRGRSGVRLTLAGEHAVVSGAVGQPVQNELHVRIDVLAWDADPIVMIVREDNRDVEVPGWRGRADLQFTVANATGEVLVREREVRSFHDDEIADPRRREWHRERAIMHAAGDAVRAFIIEISPQRRTYFLAFDDGDNGQAAIINDRAATLDGLEQRLRRYVAKNPGNAIAHHNLGVILEARGRYEDALIEHDRALDIVPREGFFDARSDTIRHRAAWEQMFGPRPVAKADDDVVVEAVEAAVPAPQPVAVDHQTADPGVIESSGATAPPVP